MKFLANENFPIPSVQILRELGIEVTSITETTPVISDKEVIQIAQKRKPDYLNLRQRLWRINIQI